jgi:hypothetical protein
MTRIDVKLLSLTLACGLLAGCSTMPEWTKPSTWVDGVTDATKSAEPGAPGKSQAAEVAKPVAAPASAEVIDPLAEEEPAARIQKADAPTEFPKVGSQPAARELTTTESQRREIRDGLVADRDNARHSAEELRTGATPAAAPPAPATKPPAAKPADPDGSN